MPLYHIYHSLPLTRVQKGQLAKTITELHASTFKSPTFFSYVSFVRLDPTEENDWAAGNFKPQGTNRITGMLRTSDTRPKKLFDDLAEKIEDTWNRVVGLDQAQDREVRRLHAIYLFPMITARERGIAVPGVGSRC